MSLAEVQTPQPALQSTEDGSPLLQSIPKKPNGSPSLFSRMWSATHPKSDEKSVTEDTTALPPRHPRKNNSNHLDHSKLRLVVTQLDKDHHKSKYDDITPEEKIKSLADLEMQL